MAGGTNITDEGDLPGTTVTTLVDTHDRGSTAHNEAVGGGHVELQAAPAKAPKDGQ